MVDKQDFDPKKVRQFITNISKDNNLKKSPSKEFENEKNIYNAIEMENQEGARDMDVENHN